MDELTTRTSPLRIAFAWILVTIPLGWGVYATLQKAIQLFR